MGMRLFQILFEDHLWVSCGLASVQVPTWIRVQGVWTTTPVQSRITSDLL